MKKVVFASFAKFPRGDSNAIHFVNIGTIFLNLGYEVHFVGFGNEDFNDEFGEYHSLKTVKSKNNIVAKVLNHLNMEKKVAVFLMKKFADADVIIFSDCLNKKWFRKIADFYSKVNPKSKLIISMTEEYEKDEFDKMDYFAKRGLKRNQYLNNDFNDKRFRFICISKFLEAKFKNRGFKTIYLPFTFSNSFIGTICQKEHDCINFIYTGSPNNKDRLLLILKAFSLIEQKGFCLSVVGVDEKWIKDRDNDTFQKIKHFTTFFGRKEYEFVRSVYETADFSLLLRDPNKTFTKAGCPTKIVESLFFGVPPITNLTGDLKDFLIDMDNSIIVKDCSAESFAFSVERALMQSDNLQVMKCNAKETAQTHLESSKYIDKIVEILDN